MSGDSFEGQTVTPEMNRLLRFPSSVRRDPGIDAWLDRRPDALAAIARHWFEVMRRSGADVRELLHDGHPTACVGDAAFGYVNVFTAHVNVGFFCGAELADPNGLLQGTGKYMRHVKIRPGNEVDESALDTLIKVAYADIKRRLEAGPDLGREADMSMGREADMKDNGGAARSPAPEERP